MILLKLPTLHHVQITVVILVNGIQVLIVLVWNAVNVAIVLIAIALIDVIGNAQNKIETLKYNFINIYKVWLNFELCHIYMLFHRIN